VTDFRPAVPTWTIDPVHSSVEFLLEYMERATYRIGFRALEGTIGLDLRRSADLSVPASIPVAGVSLVIMATGQEGASTRQKTRPVPSSNQ
jgi:polyisoprenoid-binding protein YceI